MANTFTSVIPQLLAQGLQALRQQAVMARLVNRSYEAQAAQKGTTVNVPIPSAITAQAVTAANTPPATADVSPTHIAVALDQWYEAPFYLTDKELLEVMDGTIPMQASEAIKALANNVDAYILSGMYKSAYGWSGTPATTPFATDLTVFTGARKELANQLCPLDPRFAVIDADAEANALNLRAFQDASFRGDIQGIVQGQIGMKLGALWVMDQLVSTSCAHTAGTVATSFIVKAATAHAVGLKVITTTTGGNAALVEGDVITFAGDTQTYVLTAAASRTGAGDMTINIEPGLKVALVGSEVITIKASHTANLLFHRDAFAFATRPLEAAGPGNFASAVDPVSGLTLRLEVTREHKRWRYSYDVLYGGKTVRREFIARMVG